MNELFSLDVTECIKNNFKVVQSGPFKNQILSLDVRSSEDNGIFLEAVTDSITPFESNLKPGQPIEEVHDISIQDTLGHVIHIKDVYIAKSSWELDRNGRKTRSNVKFSSICRDVEDVNNVYCTIETVSNLENVFNRGPSHLTAIQRKTITTNNSIKIYGNPNLKIDKKIIIKNYLKDHRVFMTSVIAALTFGGKWVIHDKDSIKTSFPSFIKMINILKN